MLLSQSELKRILPHAYPFLLIDEVTELVKGERLKAVKNITANEWFFQNPASPITHMPETLMIEAAAQSALVLYHESMIQDLNIMPRYMLGIVKSRLFDCFSIGNQIIIEAFATKMLYSGGYSDILLWKKNLKVGKISIVYRVIR